jgi:hypothetical protein
LGVEIVSTSCTGDKGMPVGGSAHRSHHRRPLLVYGSLGALRLQGGSSHKVALEIEMELPAAIFIAILRESH